MRTLILPPSPLRPWERAAAGTASNVSCPASTLGYACSLAASPGVVIHYSYTASSAASGGNLSMAAVFTLAGASSSWIAVSVAGSAGQMVPADAVASNGDAVGAYRISGCGVARVPA